ncbi:hypothetical protein [Amycolatopsis thermoflava]|uniref:hypothetical protein n=1 Tax=Amycolatopsis thermoflava TaxID=84480 RepID=UPI003648BFD2
MAHRAGHALQHQSESRGDLVQLEVDLGVLLGGHPRGHPERARQGQQEPHAVEHLPDPFLALFAGQAVAHRAVDRDHTGDALRVAGRPVRRERRAARADSRAWHRNQA